MDRIEALAAYYCRPNKCNAPRNGIGGCTDTIR